MSLTLQQHRMTTSSMCAQVEWTVQSSKLYRWRDVKPGLPNRLHQQIFLNKNICCGLEVVGTTNEIIVALSFQLQLYSSAHTKAGTAARALGLRNFNAVATWSFRAPVTTFILLAKGKGQRSLRMKWDKKLKRDTRALRIPEKWVLYLNIMGKC